MNSSTEPEAISEPVASQSADLDSRAAASDLKQKPNKFHWKEILKAIAQLYVFYLLLSLAILFLFKDIGVLHPMQDTSWKSQIAQMDKLFKTVTREVKIPTADGKTLHGLLVAKPASDKLILVSHGNAGNIGHRVGLASLLSTSGASTLLYDYQGFGESTGNATCNNLLKDGLTAYDYAVDKLGYKPANITIYGESVGCGVTTYIMENRKPGKVILQSGFTSLLKTARDKLFFMHVLPESIAPEPNFDNLSAVQKPHPPILFMHGDKDQILPFSYCETLYAKALPPKQMYRCKDEGHNDIGLKNTAGFVTVVKEFVNAP